MYENFKRLMHQHGLTAYKVAKDTGISQSVLSTWKTGKHTPGLPVLQTLADYFGVSLDALCGRAPTPLGAQGVISTSTQGTPSGSPPPLPGAQSPTFGAQAFPGTPSAPPQDIEGMVDDILSRLSDSKSGTLMLNGKPTTAKSLEYLRNSIRANIEYAKRLNDEAEQPPAPGAPPKPT